MLDPYPEGRCCGQESEKDTKDTARKQCLAWRRDGIGGPGSNLPVTTRRLRSSSQQCMSGG